MVTAFIHKDINIQIKKLYSSGGNSQKAADKCKTLIYDIKNTKDPLKELSKYPTTNHGETRIKHCVKYDLPGFCRLVTIQDNGWLVLLFLGTHDEVDKWINSNKGLSVAIIDATKGLFEVLISDDITNPDTRISPIPDYSSSFLYEKLKHYWDIISEDIPVFIKKTLEKLDTSTDDEEIFEIADSLESVLKKELIFDVFMALRGGKVDEAKNRILTYQEQIRFIDELTVEEVQEVSSNDNYLNLDELDSDDMKILLSNKNWMEWMLFMHPSQKQVVERDFSGSARLLGVSGSGKTCILVRRAVRLAKKYPGDKILILTLNESLSSLINDLVDKLLDCNEESQLKENIEVQSFWQLCKSLLIKIRNRPIDVRILGPKTDKHDDTIEEIWEEYYRCDNNNDDAKVLFPIHQNLLARNVYPQEYLKQEFDWIRSCISNMDLENYLSIQRENRAIQFIENDRINVIQGMIGWQNKMDAVGAIDYLGLANELYNYINEINPTYRSILVDEVQDFGTLELEIIRKLTQKAENDLFLCGDIAQQVYFKHHQIRTAGIIIPPDSYLKILKNYRNSREILSAAYQVFCKNTDPIKFKSDDFEILNPEFANFSSPKPFIRKGKHLTQELRYAIQYLKEILDEKEKGCIAICDYTIFEVERLGEVCKIPVLTGSSKLSDDNVYLSDLEQTKGFEFDRMVIINVSEDVFPNSLLPEDEAYREISKFYVAMTRAKKELIISYSKQCSKIFELCDDYFTHDVWTGHEILKDNITLPVRNVSNVINDGNINRKASFYLYSRSAVGLSKDLQAKLLELVNGRREYVGNVQVGWINMQELKTYLLQGKEKPKMIKLFGPNNYKELIGHFHRS